MRMCEEGVWELGGEGERESGRRAGGEEERREKEEGWRSRRRGGGGGEGEEKWTGDRDDAGVIQEVKIS